MFPTSDLHNLCSRLLLNYHVKGLQVTDDVLGQLELKIKFMLLICIVNGPMKDSPSVPLLLLLLSPSSFHILKDSFPSNSKGFLNCESINTATLESSPKHWVLIFWEFHFHELEKPKNLVLK